MPQAKQINSTASKRVSSKARLCKKQSSYTEVDENNDEEKSCKKQKSSPLVVKQPSNIFEKLPSQLFSHLTSFLDPNGLIRLSFAAKAIYSIMDDNIWNEIIQKRCKGPASKYKPRTPRRKLVMELAAKFTCQHCNLYFDVNLKLIRAQTEYYGKRLCAKCFNLPIYKEISYTNARNQFGLTRPQLLTLNFREVMTLDFEDQSSFPRKMYNLKEVMDLAYGQSNP